MSLSQLKSVNSPLSDLQLTQLQQVMRDLDPTQVAWVSGYLAGASVQPVVPESSGESVVKLTVLYGSQTGNARAVAENLADAALAAGLDVALSSTADFRERDLTKLHVLLLVVSTQGEGEPPESAHGLHRYIFGKRAPQLQNLNYAIFGLGDSSYEHFNQTAKDFDQRLAELGATRLFARTDADLDYAAVAQSWTAQALKRAAELLPDRNAQVLALPGVELNTHRQPRKDHPFAARLLEQRRITTLDASADVRHVVLEIDPDKLRFSPGDALGVWFRNAPDLVEEVLSAVGIADDAVVDFEGKETPLTQLLGERFELTQLNPQLVGDWAELSRNADLHKLVSDKAALRAFIDLHQVADVAQQYPVKLHATQLIDLLRPLQPRLYSIASSQDDIPDEVHLTVAVSHKGGRLGGASGFLAERLTEDQPLDVYVVENRAFRLPEFDDTPVILIGAGTGIAPYRAFLQHRAVHGHQGENWLLFGNRHFQRDFLYQTDWQDFRKKGLLTRVDLAFSRDQAEKVYVQDRLRQQAAAVFQWLSKGAQIYVCGSTAMGRDVHQALLDVVSREAGISGEDAAEFIDELRQSGRYQRDVY